MKNIYELDLHESVVVQVKPIDKRGYLYEMQVTRLPSGWLYTDLNPKSTNPCEFFVPFDNKFQS